MLYRVRGIAVVFEPGKTRSALCPTEACKGVNSMEVELSFVLKRAKKLIPKRPSIRAPNGSRASWITATVTLRASALLTAMALAVPRIAWTVPPTVLIGNRAVGLESIFGHLEK